MREFIRMLPLSTGHELSVGFPGGSDGKESACNAGDPGSIPELGRSPEKGTATHSIILLGEFHGQRSLVSYSPWGRKESDISMGSYPHTFEYVAESE